MKTTKGNLRNNNFNWMEYGNVQVQAQLNAHQKENLPLFHQTIWFWIILKKFIWTSQSSNDWRKSSYQLTHTVNQKEMNQELQQSLILKRFLNGQAQTKLTTQTNDPSQKICANIFLHNIWQIDKQICFFFLMTFNLILLSSYNWRSWCCLMMMP